jgi:hypothetical protein
MPDETSRTRLRAGSFVGAVVGAVSWFVGCGGTAVVDAPGSTAGASSTAGGSTVAGASSVAGAGATAGASSGAGASPTAGAAGSTASDACTAALDPGPCEAAIPSFWHDPKTNLCVPFTYGGCSGNANRYQTRDACIQACQSASDDFSACVNDSNCSLVSANCCGPCEPFRNESVITINQAHVATYTNAHCASVGVCAPCMPVAENEQTGKYLKPVCRNTHCTLIDVRESPLSECQKTSDCALRDGAGCCPECDGSGWVPLNKAADVCGGAPTICNLCTSLLPVDWDTVCLSGRCRLEGPL